MSEEKNNKKSLAFKVVAGLLIFLLLVFVVAVKSINIAADPSPTALKTKQMKYETDFWDNLSKEANN